MIIKGLSNAEIAEWVDLSEAEIETLRVTLANPPYC